MSDNTLKHYSDALSAYVLPTWKDYAIDSIQREDITNFLNSQAAKYSRSSLKSMRLVLIMTLTWAERNGSRVRQAGWTGSDCPGKLAVARSSARNWNHRTPLDSSSV